MFMIDYVVVEEADSNANYKVYLSSVANVTEFKNNTFTIIFDNGRTLLARADFNTYSKIVGFLLKKKGE